MIGNITPNNELMKLLPADASTILILIWNGHARMVLSITINDKPIVTVNLCPCTTYSRWYVIHTLTFGPHSYQSTPPMVIGSYFDSLESTYDKTG